MFRGEALFATADKANEEAKSRGTFSASQRRFYLPPGKESEIIILDKRIEVGAFEHDLPIPGKQYKQYVACIAAVPGLSCPLCRAGDRRTYRMFATVLDLSTYTSKQGKVVTRSKKLLAINQGDKERWQSIQQDTIKLHGTMRGTYIFMKRSNEQRSARTGEPFAIEGRLWQHMTEAELVASYGHKAVVENGKTLRVANDDITAHNYDEIFPFPDEEYVAAMEAKYGNGVPQDTGAHEDAGEATHTGSAAEIEQAWNEEIQEGNLGEAASIEGLGEKADAKDEAAAQTLTEVAVEVGVDVEAYASWAEVEAAIVETRVARDEAPLEPEPVKPTPRPVLKRPAPVAKPGIARPGIAKPALALRRPGAPAPVAKPGPGKPGGLLRPNRAAFQG